MSEENKTDTLKKLQKGYQGTDAAERGYTPVGKVPSNPEPPRVGSAAVKPSGNSAGTSKTGENGAGKS